MVVAAMPDHLAPRKLLHHLGNRQEKGGGVVATRDTGKVPFSEKTELQIDFAIVAIFIFTGIKGSGIGMERFAKGVDILFWTGNIKKFLFGIKGKHSNPSFLMVSVDTV